MSATVQRLISRPCRRTSEYALSAARRGNRGRDLRHRPSNTSWPSF